MDKKQKERVVSELSDRLKNSETMIVADYRGLTMPQIDALRDELLKHGARFQVVKNTLTKRAAETAGTESLLALLEGPTAIAFIETGGDPVAVAKALQAAAKDTQVLELRGGILQGRVMSSSEVASLATLPALDVLRGQVLGAITAPLTTIVGLLNAPLTNLVGLIDARIEQLGGAEEPAAPEPVVEAEPEAAAEPEPATEEEGEDT
jgi:large subunit ribosomal protein L10